LIGTPLPSERRKALEHSPKHERDQILEHLSIYMQSNKSQDHRVAICSFSHVGFLVPFERLQLHLKRSKFVSLLSLIRPIHVKSRDPPVFSSLGQYPHARAKNSHHNRKINLILIATSTLIIYYVSPQILKVCSSFAPASPLFVAFSFIAFSFTQQAPHLPFRSSTASRFFLSAP